MAFRCEICSKSPSAGKSVSHSHKASKRRFLPNVHQVKVLWNGTPRSMKVCSRCVRSEKVIKVGPRLLPSIV